MSLTKGKVSPLNFNAPNIKYEVYQDRWVAYQRSIVKKIAASPDIKTVCEIGGGANPFLDLDFIQSHGLEYSLLDISGDELSKAPDEYHKIQANIADPNLNLTGEYDFVFSHFLAEHVEDGHVFHRNVLNLLGENGRAYHVFPTLYSFPFLVNYFLPEKLSSSMILFFFPGRHKEGRYGKFPAFYSWCKGPIKSQIKKFENLGYAVEEYVGYYGHSYYEKLPILHKFIKFIANFMKNNPNPFLTTYSYVVLRKS